MLKVDSELYETEIGGRKLPCMVLGNHPLGGYKVRILTDQKEIRVNPESLRNLTIKIIRPSHPEP